ncbi:MAG: hypothetical protein LBS36_07605 [Oscillospiraceae bacterium]|nr:hypothetical protein [Oscillospiraceae bacterium]
MNEIERAIASLCELPDGLLNIETRHLQPYLDAIEMGITALREQAEREKENRHDNENP